MVVYHILQYSAQFVAEHAAREAVETDAAGVYSWRLGNAGASGSRQAPDARETGPNDTRVVVQVSVAGGGSAVSMRADNGGSEPVSAAVAVGAAHAAGVVAPNSDAPKLTVMQPNIAGRCGSYSHFRPVPLSLYHDQLQLHRGTRRSICTAAAHVAVAVG